MNQLMATVYTAVHDMAVGAALFHTPAASLLYF